MDVFKKRYFNFNRKLFVIMGLWPFESKTRNIRKYLLLFILFVYTFPHSISVKVNVSDVDRVILNWVLFLICFLMFLKVLAMIIAEDKMKELYTNIANNWLIITDVHEKEILLEYSEGGRKKAKYYFVFVQFGIWSVFILPAIPKILDVISPLSTPRQRIYILEDELFLDRETYYWLYFTSDVIAIILNGSVSLFVDAMYIVCIEHCCSLYAILRYRLRNLKPKIIDSSTGIEVDSYDYLIGIVRLHRSTLKFAQTVKAAYSLLFLYLLTAAIPCIPLCGVTVVSNLDKPFNCIRFCIVFVLMGVHLFMIFWPAQNVINHSIELLDNACYNEWYALPVRTRKLMIIFMIRCSQPTVLSAGGLMLVNFETFVMIIKTSISYIAVAASFRET